MNEKELDLLLGAALRNDDEFLSWFFKRVGFDAEGIKQSMRRARVPALNEHPMRVPLQMKVLVSEWGQAVAHLGMEIEGAQSSLYLGDENAPDGAAWPLSYMNSYGTTIAAGTNEIQRNILGERVLDLPKSK